MPTYDKSGTENLRAQPSVKGPSAHEGTKTSGPNVGGTESPRANLTIKTGPTKQTGDGKNRVPAKTFSDHEV